MRRGNCWCHLIFSIAKETIHNLMLIKHWIYILNTILPAPSYYTGDNVFVSFIKITKVSENL